MYQGEPEHPVEGQGTVEIPHANADVVDPLDCDGLGHCGLRNVIPIGASWWQTSFAGRRNHRRPDLDKGLRLEADLEADLQPLPLKGYGDRQHDIGKFGGWCHEQVGIIARGVPSAPIGTPLEVKISKTSAYGRALSDREPNRATHGKHSYPVGRAGRPILQGLFKPS